METWLDLHMHTKYSMDGQFEPADLMRQCADAGVTTVAVTDHDSARAIPEARQEAARLGLNLVPGIEISCQYKGKNFHLLGYGIHAEDPVFAAIEKDVYGQRRAISEKVLDAVEALGIVLDRPAIWLAAAMPLRPSISPASPWRTRAMRIVPSWHRTGRVGRGAMRHTSTLAGISAAREARLSCP